MHSNAYLSTLLQQNPLRANQRLMPPVGVRSFNLPCISEADYIELVDFTGRELHQVSKEISQRRLRGYWLCADF